jgi:hypothetical protein
VIYLHGALRLLTRIFGAIRKHMLAGGAVEQWPYGMRHHQASDGGCRSSHGPKGCCS